MPIEKKPVSPVSSRYTAPDFREYKVKDNDSWESLARTYNMDVWELIYQNFKTQDIAETNWYLHHHVGCTKKTKNGANWVFSSKDTPGIVRIPTRRIIIPAGDAKKKSEPKFKNVWAGLGKGHSGDLFIVGAHDLTGMIYNMGDELPNVRNAMLNINGYKLGLGLGGSVGAVFILAHGYDTSSEMQGVSGGWDFDIAIMAKLGDFLKGVRDLRDTVNTIQKYKKMRYLTENLIKNMGVTEPGIYTIPIPLAGVGVHLWGGYKFGDVSVLRTGKGIF